MKSSRDLIIKPISLLMGVALLLMTHAAYAITVSYTYDELGRLTNAAYSNNNFISYTYDSVGNITDITTSGVADADNDGINNSVDNCPATSNANQLNSDNDSLGNACDADDDNDGVSDLDEIANGTDPLDSNSGGNGASPTDIVSGVSVVDANAVTSPNGGEVWLSGTSQNVTWNNQLITGSTVELYVLHDDPSGLFDANNQAQLNTVINAKNWNHFAQAVPNTGSYQLDPALMAGSGNAYVAMVVSSQDKSIFDISNGMFTLGSSNTGNSNQYSNLISGTVRFEDDNGNTLAIPNDAWVGVLPSQYADSNQYSRRLICKVDQNGQYGQVCHSDSDLTSLQTAFANPSETYQLLVFKNHINTSDNDWNCGEDVYKFFADRPTSSAFANMTVRTSDYQSRSGETCSGNNNSVAAIPFVKEHLEGNSFYLTKHKLLQGGADTTCISEVSFASNTYSQTAWTYNGTSNWALGCATDTQSNDVTDAGYGLVNGELRLYRNEDDVDRFLLMASFDKGVVWQNLDANEGNTVILYNSKAVVDQFLSLDLKQEVEKQTYYRAHFEGGNDTKLTNAVVESITASAGTMTSSTSGQETRTNLYSVIHEYLLFGNDQYPQHPLINITNTYLEFIDFNQNTGAYDNTTRLYFNAVDALSFANASGGDTNGSFTAAYLSQNPWYSVSLDGSECLARFEYDSNGTTGKASYYDETSVLSVSVNISYQIINGGIQLTGSDGVSLLQYVSVFSDKFKTLEVKSSGVSEVVVSFRSYADAIAYSNLRGYSSCSNYLPQALGDNSLITSAPQISSIADLSINEGDVIHLNNAASNLEQYVNDTDTNISNIQFSIVNANTIDTRFGLSIGMSGAGFEVRSDNSIHAHPAADFSGETVIQVQVKDPEGNLSNVVSFTITINETVVVTDSDGDGVEDIDDDFINDASASIDTDGDGQPDKINGASTTGLVEDTDDDNDGISDLDEIANGTDPLDSNSGGNGSSPTDIVSGVSVVDANAVTSPNGGEVWLSGTSQNVTWNNQLITGSTVELYVLHDDPSGLFDANNQTQLNTVINAKNWHHFAQAVPNTGSYQLDPALMAGSGNAYVAMVVSSQDKSVFDIGNGMFTLALDTTQPVISVPISIEITIDEGMVISSNQSELIAYLAFATATDNVDGPVSVTNDTEGLDEFPLGTTVVRFSATDASGNAIHALSTFTVNSLDNDADGLPNTYELQHAGLDINSPDDASGDLDGDGLSNLEEFQQGFNIAVDDVPPVLTIPSNVTVNSTGPTTPVDLGLATAVDFKDGTIIPSVNDFGPFIPGHNVVTWSATDQSGNVATDQQIVDVIPMVSFTTSQSVDEGSGVTVSLSLNGSPVAYPVVVPFTVSGSADSSTDHDLIDDDVTIESPDTSATLNFSTAVDDVWEGDETVVITMGSPSNAVEGSMASHTVTIKEENIIPVVTLGISQGGKPVTTITADGGLVTLTATIADPNPNDQHVLDWSQTSSNLVPTNGYNNGTFVFDPSLLTAGLYNVAVSATDDGQGQLISMIDSMLRVISTAPVLSAGNDSDGDGVSDLDEGTGDSDQDRIPDYLDSVDAANQLPSNDNDAVMQVDNGLKLRLGETAFAADVPAAQVTVQDLMDHGGSGGGVATNAEDNAYQFLSGVFDFEVSGTEPGDSVRVIIPQASAVPANAVYRKYTSGTGWFDFSINAKNLVASAPGALGICPAPGDVSYINGLTEGHFCVQLTIEDGGENDADNQANGVVKDPGGVAVQLIPVPVVGLAKTETSGTAFNTGDGEQVVFAFSLSSDSTDAEVHEFTVSASGEMDLTTDIESVTLYRDDNKNGIPEAVERVVMGSIEADNGDLSFALPQAYQLPVGDSHFLITYQF